ncbi:MAG TPA: 30S ribosomal protein S24e [Candidatus Bathyarchaeota archaeon]|nr:30S ribosomal protein S24e [Candidatus Bathyarchaeota archaeon]
MELKHITYRYNPLLERKEVYFEIDHSDKGSTPTRLEVRQMLAEHFGVELDRVIVRKIEALTGTMVARGEAHIYDTAEMARFVEPEHILRRNKALPEGEGEGGGS